jgi:hypothetical protein
MNNIYAIALIHIYRRAGETRRFSYFIVKRGGFHPPYKNILLKLIEWGAIRVLFSSARGLHPPYENILLKLIERGAIRVLFSSARGLHPPYDF